MKTLPLLALLLALAPSCVVYEEDADVEIFWEFAGADCARAGVSELLIEMDGPDLIQTDFIPCESGRVEFSNIDRGFYRVAAFGYPPGSSGPTWIADVDVDIHGGFNQFTLVLEPLR